MSSFSEDLESLIAHLRRCAVRLDGPFTLRSGAISSWYLDARMTTWDGAGATLVGRVMASLVDSDVTAVGGMTMGADPIAVATAVQSSTTDQPLRAFSVRKAEKDHGVGGRLVGPVAAGDAVAALEDTTTTGSALVEAISVMQEAGLDVRQAMCLVDRSNGAAAEACRKIGVELRALVLPSDLGVGDV